MLCDICGAEAWYVCGQSGRPVCPQHARIEIVSRLSFGSSDTLAVREATPDDRDQIKELADHFRVGESVNAFEKDYDIASLPAFVVSANSHLAGVLIYSIEEEALVIVALDVLPGYQGLGAGKMLIEAAEVRAIEAGKSTVLTASSNDDLPSIYFYQRNGFQIYDVKPNLVAEHHGELRVGFGGIPTRDEIRLRWERSS